MKNILILLIILFCVNNCIAQDVVNRKKTVTLTVTEKYHTVIETDKEVKQGLFQAFYNKTLIASGQYTDDKRTGIWLFYNKDGRLAERYNYNTSTLMGELPDDSLSSFRYSVDEKFKATDQTTKPVKVGGRYYGYVPYLKLFKAPEGVQVIGVIFMEILISPAGRLADYKIHLPYGKDDDVVYMNTDLLTDEDKNFIPATINGQAVMSRIFIRCHLNSYGELDID